MGVAYCHARNGLIAAVPKDKSTPSALPQLHARPGLPISADRFNFVSIGLLRHVKYCFHLTWQRRSVDGNSVTINIRQRLGDRRVNSERRSGEDTRSAEERKFLGERRLNSERRFGLDRRLEKQPKRRNIFLYMVATAGTLLLVDVYFFDGMHSTDIVQTMARELISLVSQWIAPAFAGR